MKDTRGEVARAIKTLEVRAISPAVPIELYLKCLIQVEQQLPTTPRGHGLIDLFEQLSQEKRDRIKALFDAKEPPSSDIALWEFDKVLTSLNDAFVSWRYAHEYGMKQTTFDTRLAISIQETVLEHMPAWRRLIQFTTISASSTQ